MKTPGLRARRMRHAAVAAAAYLSLASFAHAPADASRTGAAGLAALERLQAGNERFVRGGAAEAGPAPAEAPVAMVLSCADARTAPEIVFGTAPGELYVVRSFGQVVDRSVTASLEHGSEGLHLPLLVVMGHDSCAAVSAAAAPAPALSAHLDYLMKAIRAGLPRTASEQNDVRAAVLANVEQVINDLLGGSALMRTAVQEGRLLVVGAYYESGTGQVVFSEPVGPSMSWH
ncbi:MAG: carbonic anhydrase [Vicinamibacterales bacterium]